MREGQKLLTAEESHRGWCLHTVKQTQWPDPWDATFHAEVEAKVRCAMGRAWATRGQGAHDAPISQVEVYGCVRA